MASGKKAEDAAEDAAKQREVIRVIEKGKRSGGAGKGIAREDGGRRNRTAKRDGDLAVYFGVFPIFSEL